MVAMDDNQFQKLDTCIAMLRVKREGDDGSKFDLRPAIRLRSKKVQTWSTWNIAHCRMKGLALHHFRRCNILLGVLDIVSVRDDKSAMLISFVVLGASG